MRRTRHTGLVGITATKRNKMMKDFATELAIMVKLRSPRIVSVYGVVTCVEINQCVGCTDNSSLSHFSVMTRPCWPRRAMRNRHRHAIEQAARDGVEDDAKIQHERAVKF